MNKTSNLLNSSFFQIKGNIMKNTAMSPSDRLIKNFASAYRELNIALNESELKP